ATGGGATWLGQPTSAVATAKAHDTTAAVRAGCEAPGMRSPSRSGRGSIGAAWGDAGGDRLAGGGEASRAGADERGPPGRSPGLEGTGPPQARNKRTPGSCATSSYDARGERYATASMGVLYAKPKVPSAPR